ncbi:MAG TPA: 4Fe-4S dicluster domain-containing protein [Cyclobacteriaceae bacterium]|nr:4Fe-4S dicluster domain-containing protein [Cyclobacteriaceae bacterium]
MDLFKRLNEDVRFREGLKACMNCGICTAICPAAEFYDYDPRVLVTTVESMDNEEIESLLKSDAIWYCGQCMSCKTRCPRGNVPGMIVSVLRKVSQELGYFTESRMGRQQYAIAKTVGDNILSYGYCVHPSKINPGLHPEQGPVWEWIFKNREDIYTRLGANFDKPGAGALRKISREALDELKAIFDETGGTELLKKIEEFSLKKAHESGFEPNGTTEDDYFREVYKKNDHSGIK